LETIFRRGWQNSLRRHRDRRNAGYELAATQGDSEQEPQDHNPKWDYQVQNSGNQAMNQYEYLPLLTKTEMRALLSIVKKFGVRGLLGSVLEIAQFNVHQNPNISDTDKATAELVAREFGAAFDRVDGFQELVTGSTRQ
jgi:hypothetical protein